MSYSEFDSFDNIEKMLDVEKRRFKSPFNYEGAEFTYASYVDPRKHIQLENKHATNDKWLDIPGWTGQEDDRVNSPSHYTRGTQEAIDIIEEAIQDAPTPGQGLLQGQVLKYMLRLWLKDNPVEDAKKARWYLDRLIQKMEEKS